MFVKPREGVKVRDPGSKLHIPEAGMEVPDGDSYWVRRLQDGDVALATPPAAPAAKTTSSPAKGSKE